jgi:leucyl-tRNA synthetase
MMDANKANYWLPVDQYVGGVEHAILHLLYSRFFHKLLRDEGLVKSDEPYKRLLCQGMVLAESYYRSDENAKITWIAPNEVEVHKNEKGLVVSATLKADGLPVEIGGMTKMSKSKNNGIDPQEVIALYGADTIRLFTMFAAPPEQTLEWIESGVEGQFRFIKRFWKLVQEHIVTDRKEALNLTVLSQNQKNLRRALHKTISKVTDDIDRRQTFNTAIAAIMELLNKMQKLDKQAPQSSAILDEAIQAVLKMLNPITPHLCQQLWFELGHDNSIEDSGWPEADPDAMIEDEKLIVVQVNGKVRAKLTISADASQETVEAAGLAQENVKAFVEEKTIRKIIYVPNKLLNIVAN